MTIVDHFGRTFKTLRVSLVNHCNMACLYCVSDEKGGETISTQQPVSYLELAQIVKVLHQQLNFETIRLTGGEPTLYRSLIPFLGEIKSLVNTQIKLTTNGHTLKNLAPQLVANGIESINVSLDAIDEKVFVQISKSRNLQRIIDGIDTALAVGIKVKLNAVIMQGVNESQILPLMDFAKSRGIVLRFLEVMQMGHLHQHLGTEFYPEASILNEITKKYTINPVERISSSTARYWQTTAGNQFGIIANESSPFCADCNRLRLDSYGNIFGCLSSNNAIAIKDVLHQQQLLEQRLKQALQQKQTLKFTGSSLSMLEIGG